MGGIRQHRGPLAERDGDACAICGKPSEGLTPLGNVRKLSVDHCHATGEIRGLLCTGCNSALGLFADDPERIEAAITYLECPPLELLNGVPPVPAAPVDPAASMSPRTAQVIQWRTEGVIFKEIGRRLGVSKQRAVQIWQRAQSDVPLYQTCTCGAVLTELTTPGRPRSYCSTECRPWQMWEYGLTREQFDGLVRLQKGMCAICGEPETACSNDGKVKLLSLDHCHRTAAARGFLCSRCNMGLGQVGDSARTLADAAAYLRKHRVAIAAA